MDAGAVAENRLRGGDKDCPGEPQEGYRTDVGLTSNPSLPQTHPNLPQGKGLVTTANCHQPPLVLPRRGDAGYSVCG